MECGCPAARGWGSLGWVWPGVRFVERGAWKLTAGFVTGLGARVESLSENSPASSDLGLGRARSAFCT